MFNKKKGHEFTQIYTSIEKALDDIEHYKEKHNYEVIKTELGRTHIDFIKVTYWVPSK